MSKHFPSRSNDSTSAAPKLEYKPHNTLLVQFTEETSTWFECGRNTAGRDDTIHNAQASKKLSVTKNTKEIVAKYRRLADEIFSHEVALSRQGGSSAYSEKDEKWVENTMKRGTLKDRVAAMSVVVGSDCLHKLYALDLLLDLAGCGIGGSDVGAAPNSRVGQMASEAISDLFANSILPHDRKLVSLDNRPLFLYEGGKTLSPRVLLLWRYEEMIMQRYASYLSRYLGRTLSGEDEQSKKNALVTASSLLVNIPEGEELLLTLIVNKIGDPSRKIASAAGHQLRLVLEEHPVMINVVAREVQQLAHRPHLSPRALYNCVIFLNQMQLSRDTDDNSADSGGSLPSSLINTYFHLFEMTCKKSEAANSKGKNKQPKNSSSAMKSRLLSALLTGVNRAHPYLPLKDAGMERHIDALYRISHTAPPAAATQALMLLFQLAVGSGDAGNQQTSRRDRFYRALYSKLSDPGMFGGRQLTLFFNLLYKAMKYDSSVERVAAFAKRLLHTVLHLPSSIICGTIFLISEILSRHPELELNDGPQGQVQFDPSKREPQAAFDGKVNLQNELWELSLLAHHFHPSITKFTSNSDGKILYKGDPLKDFALAPFLDKFAFRNPKSLDKQMKRGESIAERKSGLTTSTALPMNDPSYLESNSIQVEDNFFHQFFVERAKRDEQKGIVRGSGNVDKNDSDMEDEALDAAEANEQGANFAEGDTDSEEEAFINQLAESLMARSGHGQVDFDDEDPDMEGWSDFDDSDNEDDAAGKGEDDDFMDGGSSGSDEEGNSELPVFNMDEEFSDDDGVHLHGQYSTDDDDDNETQSRAVGQNKSSSVFADADEFDKEKQLERRKKRKRHR